MKRTKTLCILLAICLLGFASIPGQLSITKSNQELSPIVSPSRPLRNYYMTTYAPYNWKDATTGPESVELTLTSDQYTTVDLPFDFTFYDETFSTVHVSENGFISFGNTPSTSPSITYFPSSNPLHHYMAAPFWADIRLPYGGGKLYVKNYTSEGYWVAEWENVYGYNWWWGYISLGTFEVILYQTGEIVFNYEFVNTGWMSGTTGLNDGVDTDFYNYYYVDYPWQFSLLFEYPTHDLSVTLDVPDYPEFGNTYDISATVTNMGINDEVDVELALYLDDDPTPVSEDIFLSLPIDASETISYEWTANEYGTFEFMAEATPVPSEQILYNNIETKIVGLYQNYTMIPDIAYKWIDASGGTELQLSDDGSIELPLGFEFPFYDQTFATVYLGANGYLSFTYPYLSDYTNDPIPSGDYENRYLIAPFWDDVRTQYGGGGGTVYTQSFGTYWVAEWVDVWHYTGEPNEEMVIGTFQVILFQAGHIIFNYDYLDETSDPIFGDGYTCGLNLGVDIRYHNSYQELNDETEDFSILFTRIIPAEVDFNPDTLNSKSKGKWVTVYIELPEGYDANEIDRETITLNDILDPESHPTGIGDHDGDGIPDLMVKFNRSAVIELMEPGENFLLTISGELYNGVKFEGTDEIRTL
ncbi:MAG: CARDB domain-containing protein [Candidatus Hodarchaeales archaeon]|jgi:hypothetical protein